MKIPNSIRLFVDGFSKLPGVGPRQAIRLAYYLAERKKEAADLAIAIGTLQKLKICPNCFFTHDREEELCGICGSQTRNKEVVAIVEKETDLISIESAEKYRGVYLCLGDIKKAGKLDSNQKERLDLLREKARTLPQGKLKEIIIAFSPTTAGDISAEIIAEYVKQAAEKTTRLGRGIPIGGEVEFADAETLIEALESRK
ncbi:MAG: toprim domain-containing protein [Parcubacteria group bacterium]